MNGWTIAGILFIFGVIFALFFWALVKGGSDADEHTEQLIDEKQIVFTNECKACNIEFSWTEKEALVKDNYGARYTIACPHCGKIMKQYIK